ncbi:hypothetical protein [Vibrio owensii]|uniref:hypothetical protein n=1 Tax=Vibrio owensii TaxID=696485 RepID=UPI0018F1792A|nr:hypothetical protein [Vibrio owensii]
MYKILAALLIFISPVSQAGLLPSAHYLASNQLWESLWPGTWSAVGNLATTMVVGCIMIFAAWVAMGLYQASIVKNEIKYSDALFIFIRLLVVTTILFILMGL